jgi:hypothetical protein
MLEGCYRALGLLVRARHPVALLVGAIAGVAVLLELAAIRGEPSPSELVALLDTPLLLGMAAWLLAQLPPGVLFRASGPRMAPGVRDALLPAPKPFQRDCRVSGWFQIGDDEGEWCLMVPSTLEIAGWGQIQARAPSHVALPRRRNSPLVPVSLRWYRPGHGPRPIWVGDPLLIESLNDRRRRYVEPPLSPARLAIAPRALEAMTPGWQFDGLKRMPALRLAHRSDEGTGRYTYVAFGSVEVRDEVVRRLG